MKLIIQNNKIIATVTDDHIGDCIDAPDDFDPSKLQDYYHDGEKLTLRISYTLTPRQFRQALTKLDLRQTVEDGVKNSEQDIQDWFNFSITFSRTDPELLSLAKTLKISNKKIDNIWATGSQL